MDSKERITNYINDLSQKDNAIKNALTNEKKNFDKMYKYIYEEARKQCEKGQNSVCIDDDTVFQWARHYWLDYVEKEEPKKQEKEVIKNTQEKIVKPAPQKPKVKVGGQLSLFDFDI